LKTVALVILFIITASFLTRPERNVEYLKESMDVYISSKTSLEDSADVAKLPVVKVLKSSSAGDFEISLKGLSRRPEVPRKLRKYLKKELIFKVSAPHCRFLDGGLRVVSCSKQVDEGPLAEVLSYRGRKLELMGVSSGVFVGDIPNSFGKMETKEFYIVKIGLRLPPSKETIEFQLITSPGNIVFSNHEKRLLASRATSLKR